MTKKQLTTLIEQIRQNFSELQIKLPMAIFPPTVEILRGLYFERSGSDTSRFYVWVFFMPLCVPSSHIAFNLGRRIGGTDQRWDFNDSLLHEKILFSIRAEAVPFLRQTQTLQLASQLASSIASTSKSPHALQASAYLRARSGDVAGAIDSLGALISSLKADVPWQSEIASRAENLKFLLTNNPDQAALQLKEWELEAIKNLKIAELIG
jgi:hypothetical protein